jgi:hypothetical protein
MALIKGLGVLIAGLLITAVSRLLAEEIGAWAPWVTRRIITLAVAWLPESRRARFDEEWQSYVDEVPGVLGKLIAALGFLLAALKVALTIPRGAAAQRCLREVALLRDSHAKVSAVVRAIQDAGSATSQEARTTAGELGLVLAESLRLADQLEAAASDSRTMLVASLLSPLVRKQFDEISEQARQINEKSELIMKTLDERKKQLGP